MSKAFTREDDGSHSDPLHTPRRGGPKRPITAEGRARLERELSDLTAARVQAGHPSLDSSLKSKQQERRILLLLAVIEDTSVVPDPGREVKGRVTFGAWVSIEDEQGVRFTYRLVGPDEANAATGSISVESPLAHALIGRGVNEWVTVDRPRGNATYRIVQVSGDPPR